MIHISKNGLFLINWSFTFFHLQVLIYLKKSLNKGEMFCDLSLLTGSFYLFFKIS